MSRPRAARIVPGCLTLLVLAAGCGGEESQRRERLAGTYTFEESFEAGPGGQVVFQRMALTLRPDGRWSHLTEATADGEPFASAADSGTYTLDGATLTTRSRETGTTEYTVAGDTLWVRTAAGHAQAEAMSGLDLNWAETYLVRER